MAVDVPTRQQRRIIPLARLSELFFTRGTAGAANNNGAVAPLFERPTGLQNFDFLLAKATAALSDEQTQTWRSVGMLLAKLVLDGISAPVSLSPALLWYLVHVQSWPPDGIWAAPEALLDMLQTHDSELAADLGATAAELRQRSSHADHRHVPGRRRLADGRAVDRRKQARRDSACGVAASARLPAVGAAAAARGLRASGRQGLRALRLLSGSELALALLLCMWALPWTTQR